MFVIRVVSLVLASALLFAHPSGAQNPFAPVVSVNEDVITGWELDQRQKLLAIISPVRASRAAAREELINDRLRMQAARTAGISLTPQDIDDGVAEFASRASLSTDEMLQAFGSRGVAQETVEIFVAAGLVWRELIRARYGPRVEIGQGDIDRALARGGSGSSVRVLLSEIIMAAPPPQAEAVMARAERISQTRSQSEFSAFARQYSATASRGRGGRLDWTALENLPPVLHPLLLSLGINEVTQPLPITNGVALFQLRGIEEVAATAPSYSAIEYAQYFLPGGRSEANLAEAARIRDRVDVCDDLYGVALGQPEERLERQSQAPSDIPNGIAIELAKLDANEISTALVSSDGQSLMVLMLCGRSLAAPEDVDRESVAAQLRQERLAALAESFLEELRADARIRDK